MIFYAVLFMTVICMVISLYVVPGLWELNAFLYKATAILIGFTVFILMPVGVYITKGT